MKNRVIILGLMAIVAFSSCVKEQPVDVKEESMGVPFEFTAIVNSKTTNDGVVTSWKADDKINLFHAETSTTDYSGNDQFTITSANLAAKKFTGTLASALDPAKSYDWYALYPYNISFTTPANTSAYVNIGGSTRTQTGYGNAAHLGELPLVGKAENVDASDNPAITMNHMAAVVKIIVTNTTTEDLTITNISLTAPTKIVGQFIVDFSDPSSLAYSDGTYCYNYCNLKVNSGTVLGNGESATFFIPIKPVTLAKDSEISIKVNTYTKEKTMPSAFTFTAGKMTTINFDYDKTFISKNFYLASSIAAGDKVVFVNSKANGSVKAMGHYSSGNNLPEVDGTISSGRLASTSSMGVFTVAGNNTDGFTFYDAENETYLNATSETKNYLKGISPSDDFALWSVSISEGVAEVLNKGTGKTTYHVRYNSVNNLFSAYTTDQSPVYIFKQDDRTPLTTYEFASATVNKIPEEATSYTGLTVTSTPSVSSTYSMTGDVIGTINSSTGELDLDGTEGTAVVTASFAGDVTYAPASASYTIIVKGKSITLTASTTNMPSSYGTANTFTEYTLEGYKFKLQQFRKYSGKLQLRAAGNENGTGTIYNTQVYPGKLKTITVTYDASDSNKNCVLHVGASENPAAGTEITPTYSGSVYTFDCSAANVDYFVLANGEYAGYLTSMKIEWK